MGWLFGPCTQVQARGVMTTGTWPPEFDAFVQRYRQRSRQNTQQPQEPQPQQPPQQPQAVFHLSLPFCADFRKTLAVDMSLHGERETGAAKRRRECLPAALVVETRAADRAHGPCRDLHHSSAPFPPKFKEEWVGRHEQHAALRGPKMARTTEATHFTSSTIVARGPELFSLEEEPGGGPPAPLPEVAGRQGRWCGTSWKISAPSARSCRFSIFLCRRWLETLQISCGSWISRLPSRLSKCPRSLSIRVHRVLLFLIHSQRNSWWKCRPCCLLCASRSRSSAFQFLSVLASGVFEVLSQDRAQQRHFLLKNAFLSGSLISPFLVEAFKSFAQVRVPQLLLRFLLDLLVTVFFALFPKIKKVRSRVRARGRN